MPRIVGSEPGASDREVRTRKWVEIQAGRRVTVQGLYRDLKAIPREVFVKLGVGKFFDQTFIGRQAKG